MHTEFWSANLTGRNHLEDLCTDRSIIFELIFKQIGCKVVDLIC
jgi:hypothetical protein